MSDVNERIDKALGHECPSGRRHLCEYRHPDYTHSIDASMAVIRERWGYATEIEFKVNAIGKPWVTIWNRRMGVFGTNEDGATDAERLAHALLAALEGESD
jgi:hypothetical protein